MLKASRFQSIIVGASIFSLVASTLVGCAGATPHPVPQYQPGDAYLNCDQIRYEIQNNQTKMLNLVPQQNKTGKNVVLGVAGAFFLVPWFFMDFSDAERIEIQAYELRNNYLMALANKKQCKGMPLPVKFQGQKR